MAQSAEHAMQRDVMRELKPGASLVVRRTIGAPVAKVYRAWSEPEVAARWSWGAGYETHAIELDCRPGGRWTQEIRHAERREHWFFDGEFVEVVPRERIVHTFAWRSDTGQVEGPSLVRVDFTDLGDRTEVVVTHTNLDPSKAAETEAGWGECLERVEGAMS